MKIAQISVYSIKLPLNHPFRLSGGRLIESLDSTIVAIDTDAGIRGWGEGCPWGSAYAPAFSLGLRAGIAEIAPSLIGLDPRYTDVVYRAMDVLLCGHSYVKSALDMACWDILGKAAGLPVCDLLGGRVDRKIPLKTSVSMGTPDEMIQSIAWGREKGHTIHSCKVGAGVAKDIETIRVISDYVPVGENVIFDANGFWLMAEALQIMNSITGMALDFEQPCCSYAECLQVRRQTNHPMVLDESIQCYGDVIRAHTDQACDALNIRIGRVGGLTKAKRIRDFCVEAGFRLNILETGGSVISDTGAVHLAQSTPSSHLQATCLIHQMLAIDIATGGARNQGGYTISSGTAGAGFGA